MVHKRRQTSLPGGEGQGNLSPQRNRMPPGRQVAEGGGVTGGVRGGSGVRDGDGDAAVACAHRCRIGEHSYQPPRVKYGSIV